MADAVRFMALRGRMFAALGAGLAALTLPATAAPDWSLVELRVQLTELSNALREDGPSRNLSVPELVDAMGIPELEGLAVASERHADPSLDAELGWTDKRFPLAAMAQVYGGEDNRDVMAAGRANETEALEVTQGVLTLDQLRARLTPRHLGRDIALGVDVLRVPLVIGKDATFRLGPGERLLLAREDGAFLVNHGRLDVEGGEISATSRAEEDAENEFVPFIASVGSGTVHITGGTFRNLGFGFTAKFSGFSVVAHPTMRPGERNVVENSRFDNLVTVALVGVRHAELRGNRFFDMRRNPLLVSRSPDAVVEGNLFSGPSPTNAVRVANGSDGARLIRNVVLEGSRAGLLVSSGSDNVVVSRNLIWRRNGGGIKLHNVACGQIEANLILDDKQKGVEIRGSRDAQVRRNRIIGNANAGVWVSAIEPGNTTYVIDNLLRENGSGFSAAAGGDIALKGNDLSDQFPRFLDGDITHQFRAIVADLRGEKPILLDSGGVRAASRLTPERCDL